MTALNRLALYASVAGVALALTGCPPDEVEPPPDAGTACTGADCETACVDNTDCPDPALFFCNTTLSVCQPSCKSKADCTAANRGDYALAYCDNNALGCQCDEGTCVAALCSSDAECGDGMACRSGSCVTAPAASSVASCRITPDFALLKTGEKATFWVSFWDAANKPVVLTEGITWSAATGRVASPVPNGAEAVFTGGTEGAAENAIQVTAGGATCLAQVAVIDNTITVGKLRVVAVNELTGRPVVGATATTHDTAGAQIDAKPIEADGSVELSMPASGNVTVSVFHSDYGYQTVANYAGVTRDLHFALRRNQVDLYGGYKGTFTDVPQSPDVHAGLAGMSIPGAVTDLSVSQLLGHTVPTDIVLGSTINQQDVPIPAGAYLAFSADKIKTEVSATGVAGVCTSALAGVTDVEQAIREGKCGTRTAWALAGDVSLGELPIDAFTGGVDNIDYGKVLSRIIPIFRKFNSSVVRDVQFTLKAPAGTPEDPDFSDTAGFTAVDHDFDSVPLGFGFAAKIPALPKFKGTFADGVVVLGGADVRGRGLVPLGLGAGVNTQEPKDALVDSQAELPSAGLVLTRMAPTHSGIEGSPYLLAAVALSLQSVNDASAGLAMSALVHRVADNKLPFDLKGASPVELSGAFVNYPENAKYNFTDGTQPGLAARQFKFVNGQDLSAASIVRIQFSDQRDHRWQIVTDPASAANGITIPKPPTGTALSDRTFFTGSTTGTRSPLLVQALKLAQGQDAISFSQIVEFNSTNADRLNDFMTAFAVIDFGRPTVSWTNPGTDGATVAGSSAIGLKVSSFKVGTTAADDGIVKITFNGGTNCTAFDITTDASAGKGELTASLPAGCTGTNVELTATLYNNQGNPIAPPVASRRTVTIQ